MATPQEAKFVDGLRGLHVVDYAAEEVISGGHQEFLTDARVQLDWLDAKDEFPLQGKQVEHELVAGVFLVAV